MPTRKERFSAARAEWEQTTAAASTAYERAISGARQAGLGQSAIRGELNRAAAELLKFAAAKPSYRGGKPTRLRAVVGECSEMCAIYVIGHQGGGPRHIKVGISRNPDRRLRDLQTASGTELHIFLEIYVPANAARAIERESHRRLHAYRKAGEWFEVERRTATDAVRAVVCEMVQ